MSYDIEMTGMTGGTFRRAYTAADYARDQGILYARVRANGPNCLLVGSCTTGGSERITGAMPSAH